MIHLCQVVLKRLAALAIHMGAGGERLVDELAAFPEGVLHHVLSSGELEGTELASQTRITRLLARDPRAAIRLQATQHLPLYERPLSDEAQRAFELLADDPEPAVRVAFLDHVAQMFDRSSILERTRLVCLWATSDNPRLRVAVARALQSPFIALGVPSAIRALSHDPDDAVRREAQVAAALRRVELEAA